MKKIMIVCFLLCLFGCAKVETVSKNETNIIVSENLNIEYRQIKYLYDLVDIDNGTFITENFLINSDKLGSQIISFKYKDINKNELTYEFKVEVKDTTKPLIFASKRYTTEKGEEIDLVSKAICGDNYTREMKCNIEGSYDINKVGEYTFKFTTTDELGNYNEKESKLVVKEKVENSIDEPIYIKDFITEHKNNNTMIGIDVSTWQGTIDWEKVKSDGVEFAIIRIGYGHDDGKMVIDKRFKSNFKNVKDANIPVGIYFYSYAKNTVEAREQAKWIIDFLNGETLDLPIAFDWENWSSFMSYKLNFHDLNDIANAFLEEITKSGYKAINYGSATYLEKIWDTPSYPTWLAYYTDTNDFEEEFYIWQKTNSGKVNGISGYVDLNILYKN